MTTPMNAQTNAQASANSYLVGLIGAGISGSLSPAMHEEEGSKLGLHYVYRRIDLEALKLDISALPDLLIAAERMGYNGLNITYPCKQAVIPLLDELSDDARALGAVNTVLFKDGKRIGHNTDWSGFARAFQRGLPDVSLERVVQLGAGGAGAAVAHAALAMGAQTLTLFDVDPARAESLAAELRKRFADRTVTAGSILGETLAAANGLIHATPTGMAKLPGLPLPAELLHRDLWVADIVYFPIRTALLAGRGSARLPHVVGRRHGGVPGSRRDAHFHRARTGCRARLHAFPVAAGTLTGRTSPVNDGYLNRLRRRPPMPQPIQSSPSDANQQSGATTKMSTSTARRSNARYQILGLLAVGTMINYLDRTVLGIAAPQLTKELGISAAMMGLLFSVFSWSYVAAQIPGGLFSSTVSAAS